MVYTGAKICQNHISHDSVTFRLSDIVTFDHWPVWPSPLSYGHESNMWHTISSRSFVLNASMSHHSWQTYELAKQHSSIQFWLVRCVTLTFKLRKWVLHATNHNVMMNICAKLFKNLINNDEVIAGTINIPLILSKIINMKPVVQYNTTVL